MSDTRALTRTSLQFRAGLADLEGELTLPAAPSGLVLFVHGSGSGRQSPRNRFVAAELSRQIGAATLLFDLSTADEARRDEGPLELDRLTSRLVAVTDWAASEPALSALRVGYFGASTGVAVALSAAADRPERVDAIVSRGGRPDLATPRLADVKAPTLLLVGGNDEPVLTLNRRAHATMKTEARLVVISGASHLFEEAGALDEVARHACGWFSRFFADPVRPVRAGGESFALRS